MQIVNNLIFDSEIQAKGAWRNISNFTALSVHVIGLDSSDSDVTIEVSNDPDVLTNNANGITITPELGSGDASSVDDILISYDVPGGPATVAMVNPSCLAWNWIRVVKTGSNATATQAWLFGQIG